MTNGIANITSSGLKEPEKFFPVFNTLIDFLASVIYECTINDI
jgi:hypothetical protein